MIKDYFILAVRNIKKRRLRSWLTMTGIFISIAAIFVLVSLSLGLQGAVKEQFRQLGTDKIFIQPKGQLGPPGSSSVAAELTTKDVDVIKKVSGVKEASFMVFGNAKIEFNDKTRYYLISGMDTENEKALEVLIESFGLNADEGRLLEKGDTNDVVIGSLYNNKELFGKKINIRDKIIINDKEFRVVGIAKSVGNPGDDQNIYMPYNTFQELFNSGDRIDFIYAQVNEGENIKEIAQRIEEKLDNFRDVNEKTRDYSILTPEELLSSFNTILQIITAFLGGIAAISLLVGGIGIMNTMYTSVLERTKEIGVMKAVGAQNKDILLIFLIESGLLGLIGGIIGVVLGFGIGKIIEYIAINSLNTTLLRINAPFWLIFSCLAFAFLIGAISGIIPAFQASKTNTVDALRYE